MTTDNLVAVERYCIYHQIEPTVFESLYGYGLIELQEIEGKLYIEIEALPQTERYIRLHYELGINFEGIDVIANLLLQIEELQKQLRAERNKNM